MPNTQDEIFKLLHKVEARANALADTMREVLENALNEVISEINKLQVKYLASENWQEETYLIKQAYLKAQRLRLEALMEEAYTSMQTPLKDAAQDVMQSTEALAVSLFLTKQATGGSVAAGVFIGGGAAHVTATMLKDWITTQTVDGLLINEWLSKSGRAAAERIIAAGRESLVLGHGARKAAAYLRAKGVSGSVPQLYALARTFLLSASHHASEAAYSRLGVQWWEYVATLDGRTCPVCGANDGQYYQQGAPRPTLPRHVNCRCVYVPLDSPPRSPQKRAVHREYDDDKAAYAAWYVEQAKRNPEHMPRPAVKHDGRTVHHRDGSTSTKFRVGSVEHTTESYAQWLKRQLREDPAFVRAILGKTRFELFKVGKITLEKMVVDGRLKRISEL